MKINRQINECHCYNCRKYEECQTKGVFDDDPGFIFYAWESDYLAISKAGYVYECEIKISHSDFLNEAIHKQNKMRILQGLSASDGTIDDRRPNYFWYVCPEGIISEAECPKFAGLMYITDSGTFRCIKSAPCLHKAKYDT